MNIAVHLILSLQLSIFCIKTVAAQNCGDVTTGDIRFTKDLHCASGSVAFKVLADDVTIDLNGHTLSGTSTVGGIFSSGHKNVTIKNGTIRGFWVGIYSTDEHRLSVKNISFEQVGYGVLVNGGLDAKIENNRFFDTRAAAVKISNTNVRRRAVFNKVMNNEFYRTRTGVKICGIQADNNTVQNNLMWNIEDWGVHLVSSNNNSIIGNRILDNLDSASIRINNSSGNLVRNNTAIAGANSGMSIMSHGGQGCLEGGQKRSDFNKIEDNLISSFGFGIVVTSSLDQSGVKKIYPVSSNRLTGNKILNNSIGGLSFGRFTSSNDARDNMFAGNRKDVYDYGIGNRR